MNFLAHLLLSGADGDLRTGGFLGDFVRGPLHGVRPRPIEQGIALHRFVDAATGRSAPLREASALFAPPWRRWAPIAIDVLFDHYLARDFERFAGEPLTDFAATCYGQIGARREHLTDPARGFLARMREVDLLCAYAERRSVERALDHLSRRVRRRNPLATINGELLRLDERLTAAFEDVMPALIANCDAWRASRDGTGGRQSDELD